MACLSSNVSIPNSYTKIYENNDNNNNLTNLQQQQGQRTTGQVQLNSTQPFIVHGTQSFTVNNRENIVKHTINEKLFQHPCLPSQRLIKFYPHKLRHLNQLFRENKPPEHIDKSRLFLIANLCYQYKHFAEIEKWQEYEITACKETEQEETVHVYNDERDKSLTTTITTTNNNNNNNSKDSNNIDREIRQARIGTDSSTGFRNETFDSETRNESREGREREIKKKRKLGDTSFSPIGLNIRIR